MSQKVTALALEHAEELRCRIAETQEIQISNGEIWTLQQELQDAYQKVLLLDLELALNQKVEQELWNVAFKKFISALQSLARDRNNPQRNDAKAMLSWFLDSASGFYLGLMQKLCSTLQLDLPFLRKDAVYGGIWKSEPRVRAQRRSGLYMCQHCLVHLGDLARYRGHMKQAEAFYRHAIHLAPNSGQPYNQLALLAASRGEQLATVFLYVRALAVRHPFTVASANLTQTLKRYADTSLRDAGTSRLSGPELITTVLKLHGVLRCQEDLTQAKQLSCIISHSFPALVATQTFTSWTLVQMLVLHIYFVLEGSSSQRNIMVDLIAASLNAYLLPAYTLSNHAALLSYCALPAIKLVLEWVLLRPEVVLETGFSQRRQIWPALSQLLNSLQAALSADPSDPEHYTDVPLPEDVDLQGFLPLNKYLSELRFEESSEGPDSSLLRASRIIQLGTRFTNTEEGSRLIQIRDNTFETVLQQVESVDILQELEALSLAADNSNNAPEIIPTSPVLSDAGSSSLGTGGKSSPDSNHSTQHSIDDKPLLWQAIEEPEPWRMPGRTRQNVAMQAILRSKALGNSQDDKKQMAFASLSPTIINPSDGFDSWKCALDLMPSPSHSLLGPICSPMQSSSPLSCSSSIIGQNLWATENTSKTTPTETRIPKEQQDHLKPQIVPQLCNPTPQVTKTPQLIRMVQPITPSHQTVLQPRVSQASQVTSVTQGSLIQENQQPNQQLWQRGNRTWDGLWTGSCETDRDWTPAALSTQSSSFYAPSGHFQTTQNYASYSLFSPPRPNAQQSAPVWPTPDIAAPQPSQLQSLWSEPSPLQRLLEQQRQQREGGT